MQTVTQIAELMPFWGGIVVPTMGALHAGHARLIERAVEVRRERNRSVGACPIVVTIFVNPTQFTDPKDLERYPRTLEKDASICAAAGADVVFAPSVSAVYPEVGAADAASVIGKWGGTLPPVATEPRLEDAFRPGHFAGVCQVVHRLFEMTRPSVAMFGEKDWQQLQVIGAMTTALALPIDIVPVPTVRERDGLAMSSRNVFLTEEERGRAAAISQALCDAAGQTDASAAEGAMRERLQAADLGVEYAVVREAATLMPVPPNAEAKSAYRALIAARLGSVRLIDNAPWPGGA